MCRPTSQPIVARAALKRTVVLRPALQLYMLHAHAQHVHVHVHVHVTCTCTTCTYHHAPSVDLPWKTDTYDMLAFCGGRTAETKRTAASLRLSSQFTASLGG